MSKPVSRETANKVRHKHINELSVIPKVVGILVRNDKEGSAYIELLVLSLPDSNNTQFPSELEGVPVVLKVSKPIKALEE